MTRRRFGQILGSIVLVAALVRIIACARGGQNFLGDEIRFDRGQRLCLALCRGDLASARAMIALPEHPVFNWITAGVTAVHRVLTLPTRFGDWSDHPEHMVTSVGLAAGILSLFSAASVLLVALVARESGAERAESLWAALLLAASNTAFYYSRSLLPYDTALCLALGGLWAALRPPSRRRSLGSGVLIGLSYQVYTGYWFLPPVLALAILRQWRGRPDRRRLAGFLVGGVLLGVGLPLVVGTLAGGRQYWRLLFLFSRTVKLGLFSEGWSLPWEYLWYSEGLVGVVVVAAVIAALVQAGRAHRPVETRARTWLAVIGAIYLLLVLFSVGLHIFVVYGRTVKALVPFFCLAGAWALHRLIAGRRWLAGGAAAALVAAGALMIAPHMTFVFPQDIEVSVLRNFGNPKHAVSVSGSIVIPLSLPVVRPDLALVNAQMLYPVKAFVGFPAGRVLERFDNVLTYRPFQYEGHTPRQRELLRTADISVQLIRLADPSSVPDQVPYGLRNQAAPTGEEP